MEIEHRRSREVSPTDIGGVNIGVAESPLERWHCWVCCGACSDIELFIYVAPFSAAAYAALIASIAPSHPIPVPVRGGMGMVATSRGLGLTTSRESGRWKRADSKTWDAGGQVVQRVQAGKNKNKGDPPKW